MSKILLVDDETSIREMVYLLLTRNGHQVMTAPNGSQVLHMIKAFEPNLVLMDLNLDGENGIDLVKKIVTASMNKIPVAVFSGKITAEIEKQVFQAGAVEVFQKGTDLKAFQEHIKKILASPPKPTVTSANPQEQKAVSEKILVVDDEEGIRNLLKTVLSRKGHEVLLAASGQEAIDIVKKERPAVILMDITMPGMDGILTLKKIREFDKEVGVVMATGMRDEHVLKEATAYGAYAYVLKPFDLKYLELVVITRLLMAI